MSDQEKAHAEGTEPQTPVTEAPAEPTTAEPQTEPAA